MLNSYDLFSEDFSGITGSGDELIKDRDGWLAINRQDFEQLKDPLRIEFKDIFTQSLSETIAVATSSFIIHLPSEDHILSLMTTRLAQVFRKEFEGCKICHCSISVPFGMAQTGEVYPLQELEERKNLLEELIAERTMELSAAKKGRRSCHYRQKPIPSGHEPRNPYPDKRTGRLHWSIVCDEASLSEVDRNLLWGNQILNPYVFEGLKPGSLRDLDKLYKRG